jgi:hypothetical protein
MSSKKPNNPYAAAASAYGSHAQQHTPDQRETEARVLLKAAQMFKDLQDELGRFQPRSHRGDVEI